MNTWIEITDDEADIESGDVCCGQKIGPDNVLLAPKKGGLDVLQSGGWSKYGILFSNPHWTLPRKRRRVADILKGQGCSAKLRFFRLYKPRVLPGNPIYAEPLPLP